jgi:hypothetical protein
MKRFLAVLVLFLAGCGARQVASKPDIKPETEQKQLWQILKLKKTGDSRLQHEDNGLLYDAEVFFAPGIKPGQDDFIMSRCPVEKIIFTIYDANAKNFLKEDVLTQASGCAACHKQ